MKIFLSISVAYNQSIVSDFEAIYINVKNFTRMWKIYLIIINNPSISYEDRILLDTTKLSFFKESTLIETLTIN